eukprot:1882342-Pleurochrysis_carterae.AAC.4
MRRAIERPCVPIPGAAHSGGFRCRWQRRRRLATVAQARLPWSAEAEDAGVSRPPKMLARSMNVPLAHALT